MESIYELIDSRNLVFVSKTNETRTNRARKDTDNLRSIMDDEIVIEFDTNDRNFADKLVRISLRRLKANGYKYFVYDAKGRSPHIHLYRVVGLEALDVEVRREYITLFFDKYFEWSEADCSTARTQGHLIAMENKPHFKHKNVMELVSTNSDGDIRNYLEPKLVHDAIQIVKYHKENKSKECDIIYDNTWLIRWLLNHFEYKTEMHNVLFKNAIIECVNRDLNTDSFRKQLSVNYNDFEHTNLYAGTNGWVKWAKLQPRRFLFSEVKEWFDVNGYDIFEEIRNYR